MFHHLLPYSKVLCNVPSYPTIVYTVYNHPRYSTIPCRYRAIHHHILSYSTTCHHSPQHSSQYPMMFRKKTTLNNVPHNSDHCPTIFCCIQQYSTISATVLRTSERVVSRRCRFICKSSNVITTLQGGHCERILKISISPRENDSFLQKV